MRHRLCLALVAAAALAVGDARAAGMTSDPDQPLSAFLSDCQTWRQDCLTILAAGIWDANDMGDICLPEKLTLDDAAAMELQWLQTAAASDAGLAAGKEGDAEWKAKKTLWPCGK